MTKMFGSSVPLGEWLRTRRCWLMNRQLQRMATVTAICTAINIAPTLLRRRADRIGLSSMFNSLSLQLQRRLHLRGAPGGIEARDDCGHDPKKTPDAEVGKVEMRQVDKL